MKDMADFVKTFPQVREIPPKKYIGSGEDVFDYYNEEAQEVPNSESDYYMECT